jgi:hypothetical protein
MTFFFYSELIIGFIGILAGVDFYDVSYLTMATTIDDECSFLDSSYEPLIMLLLAAVSLLSSFY